MREPIGRRLAPDAGDDHARVTLSGDRGILPADTATPFGVVAHVPATYAALSSHVGRVGLIRPSMGGTKALCSRLSGQRTMDRRFAVRTSRASEVN